MGIFGGDPQDQVDLDDLKARVAKLEVAALKSQGDLIHAIKLYRERTGLGLKEAKDAVEAMP